MKKTGSLLKNAGWMAVALAAVLTASCGGGGGEAADDGSGGGGTGEASYAFSATSKNLVLHFDAPVTAEAPSASASKSMDTSAIEITEKLTGAALGVGGVWLSDDGMVAVVGAPFKYLTEYSVSVEGLYYADGSEVPAIELDITTPANPDSLEDGAYADLLAADSGDEIFIATGPNLMPGPDDPNELTLPEIASTTIAMEGEMLGYPGYQMPTWAKLGDGHSFIMSKWNGPELRMADEPSYLSYLLFTDKDADPVAEFVPSDLDDESTMSFIFVVGSAGDHNGDGLADILFGEMIMDTTDEERLDFNFLIFFGREGGFAGEIAMDEADVSVPFNVYPDPDNPSETIGAAAIMMALAAENLHTLVMPPHAVGDFDGDGKSDLAHVNLDPYAAKTVVHVHLGSDEPGVRDGMPDILVTAPGEYLYIPRARLAVFPEMIMGIAAGNVNGDYSLVDGEPVAIDDLILGSSMAFDTRFLMDDPGAEAPAGKASVVFGGSDWPLYADGGSISTSTADIVIVDEDAARFFANGIPGVINARDLDGDLKSEIIVGSYRAANDEGKAYLFHGEAIAAGGDYTTGDATLFTGTAGYTAFGASSEIIGDLDNDGMIDIMIGGYNDKGNVIGYVYSGDDLDAVIMTTGITPDKSQVQGSAVSTILLDTQKEILGP